MATKTPVDLFPVPTHPPSRMSPTVVTGGSPERLLTVQNILKDNHEKWHVFFNDRGFHNHNIHHILALWALGADNKVIEAAYKEDVLIQRPAFPSPEPITLENFHEHLGDEKFYNAYLQFFTSVINEKDIASVLEEYVFSSEFNFGSKNASGQHPEMLNRFLGGLLHPMIHAGYGTEFGLLGVVVEGLAQTAVHQARNTVLIPPSIFPNDRVPSVGKLTSRIHSVKFDNSTESSTGTNTRALTILARIMRDPDIRIGKENEDEMFSAVVNKHGEALFRYANSWTLDTSDPKEVERKIEELQWMNVLIYAVAGVGISGQEFSADFFYMHLVTSSLFLPSLVAYLSPASQEALLRAYLAVCLSVYVARGSPELDVEAFFAAGIAYYPTSHGSWLPDSTPRLQFDSIPNPWLPIIEQAIVHPDDHLCKLHRALTHFSSLYGWKALGVFGTGTDLPGAEKIDGSLFIRAAGLTARRLGRDRGGEKRSTYWDREGFYRN